MIQMSAERDDVSKPKSSIPNSLYVDTDMGFSGSPLTSPLAPLPLDILQGNPIPPFLSKTFDLVDEPSLDPIISWGQTGGSFVVWEPMEFARIILPRNFKHNNFSSFVRQLNTYSFVVSSKLQGKLTAAKGFRKIDTDRWEFANECFLRGKKHLLKNIHRRRSPQSQQLCTSTSTSQGSPTEFGGEIEKLRKERETLMEEVVELQQQHRGTTHHMDTVNQRLKAAEQRQKQMLSFLAKLFQNPGFLERLKNRKLEAEQGGSLRRKLIKTRSNSPIEGQIVKYEADEWEKLLKSDQELLGEGSSNMVTDPRGKKVMDSAEDMMNPDYLMSFSSPRGLEENVKEEDIWSMGFNDPMQDLSSLNVWGSGTSMEHDVPEFGLPDISWEQVAGGSRESGFDWPTPADDIDNMPNK